MGYKALCWIIDKISLFSISYPQSRDPNISPIGISLTDITQMLHSISTQKHSWNVQEHWLPLYLSLSLDEGINIDGRSNTVSEARIKKFIEDHRKCQYFEVSLQTGENVNEVFQAGKNWVTRVLKFFCRQLAHVFNYKLLFMDSFL